MEAIIASLVEIPESVMETVVIMLMWARNRLGQINTNVCKIRATGCHGPYKLATPPQ
jgi:hypothetical protein